MHIKVRLLTRTCLDANAERGEPKWRWRPWDAVKGNNMGYLCKNAGIKVDPVQ